MRELKFEWREGPHGVESLEIIGEKGKLTFAPDRSSGFSTEEDPLDRTATLEVVKSLAEEILSRLANGDPTYWT